MNEKRKKTEEHIINGIGLLDPSGLSVKRYTEMFKTMNDKEFHTFMENLRDKKEVLYFYSANIKDKPDIDKSIAVAKKLGVELFERLRMWDEVTQSYYLSPNKYFIAQLPIRKMSQFLDHKLSVAEGDDHIDMLTGQVSKPDRAGAISQVEIQTLHARGLKNTITELVKYRGGDVVAFGEFKRELEEQGTTSIGRHTGSVARSAVVLDVFLSGIHIESNASGV